MNRGLRNLVYVIVLLAIGLIIIYSHTGLPTKEKEHETVVPGYGAGVVSPLTPMLGYVSLPIQPGEEEIPQGANPQILVQPSELKKHLNDWIIVDCRERELYEEGHIPNAIHLGESCNDFFREELEIPGVGVVGEFNVPSVEDLEKRLSEVGIRMDKTILFYDAAKPSEDVPGLYGLMAGYAFVPFWYMEWLGHKDVRVLDGGIEAWIAEGLPLETKINKLPPSNFKANVVKNRLATTEDVLKIAKGELKAQLIDNRTPDEFLGRVKAPSPAVAEKIKRAGRIPNTIRNIPHSYIYINPPNDFRLRPLYQLNRLYQGLNKEEWTVFYCVTGTRSSLNYFVARLLGFKNPALYHDSWIVWGNNETLPVVK
jgi:thiosulfate/3-mercaptopyruvate sulfurtransferase